MSKAKEPETTAEEDYELSLSLNVLNHLGLNLYSNVPAVLSEAVANAWDADAENVDVNIDVDEERIEIVDDGHGMDGEDVNNRYLNVGYRRRKDEERPNRTPEHDRPVMGRKGIGKLSLFSIAGTVEVYTAKDGEEHAFRMRIDEIEEAIEEDEASHGRGESVYTPTKIGTEEFPDRLESGTKIVLTDLKKRVRTTESALRKRLARRFGVIGAEYDFTVRINGEEVKVTDRDYFHKVQFLWTFGNDEYVDYCSGKLESHESRPNETESGYEIEGWVGTAEMPSDLVEDHPGEQEESDDLNKISLMVRGKMAKEDLLEDFNDSRMYTKYLVGEIHADFLDFDDMEDIATSSREDVVKEDPRYQELLDLLESELNRIAEEWDDLRNEQASQEAREIDAIDMWYESLNPENRDQAKKLLGKINRMSVEDEGERDEMFKHGILAFENLKYEKNLEGLEDLSDESEGDIARLFATADDVEETRYQQVASQRAEIVEEMRERLQEGKLDGVLLNYLYERPWLLDPSWERTTSSKKLGRVLRDECGDFDEPPTGEDGCKWSYLTCTHEAGRHRVICLKRPNRKVHVSALKSEAEEYRETVVDELGGLGEGETVEVVFVVGGVEERGVDEESARETDGVRILRYDALLSRAEETYDEYSEMGRGGRLSRVMEEIERD